MLRSTRTDLLGNRQNFVANPVSCINILAVAFILSPGYSVFLKIRTDFLLAYAKKGADDIPGQGQNTAKAMNTASAKQLKKNGFA